MKKVRDDLEERTKDKSFNRDYTEQEQDKILTARNILRQINLQ